MAFPFSIKYSEKLSEHFSGDRSREALEFIERFITKKTGKDIVIGNDQLTFQSKFFQGGWNTNILVPIEKGIFTIVKKEDKTILTYEFFMYRLFGIVCLMSIIMGLISGELRVGIICLAWLGGMNWIIALMRHKSMLTEIAEGINEIMINEERLAVRKL